MNREARREFEQTFASILRERTGSGWEVERHGSPAPTANGKLRRLASPADEDTIGPRAAAHKDRVKSRG